MLTQDMDPDFSWLSLYQFSQDTRIQRKALDRLVAASEIDHVVIGGKIWVPIRRGRFDLCGGAQNATSVDWGLRTSNE